MTESREVEVINSSPVQVNEAAVKQWAAHVLASRNVEGAVGIAFVGREEMRELNSRYRGLDEPTDVLSFPEVDPDIEWVDAPEEEGEMPYLGDVVISPEVARDNAAADGSTLSQELRVLLTHGLLHLLGFDHETVGRNARRAGGAGGPTRKRTAGRPCLNRFWTYSDSLIPALRNWSFWRDSTAKPLGTRVCGPTILGSWRAQEWSCSRTCRKSWWVAASL